MICRILEAMEMEEPLSISQFQNDEDGDIYQVWLLHYPDKSCVLKQAKGEEADIFRTYFSAPCAYAPQLYSIATVDGLDYILMEYIPGHDLKKVNRKDLTLALDALISMQTKHWMVMDSVSGFDRFLTGRKNRRNYLWDAQLERAYDAYLAEFSSIPRTLCHDDLLPFNVIVSPERAVLIDWEVAGILPYPTSLARLIAHCEEDPDAFFYMTQEDRAYAIDYYYLQFAHSMGINRRDFEHSMELCLFYEYCEWVYVGNKYADRDNERFRRYLEIAKQQATKLGF